MVIKTTTPSRTMSKWTKQDRKTLRTMTREGKTIKEISDALGRTPPAVIYQRSQMGLIKTTKKIKVNLKSPKIKTSKGVEVSPPTVVTQVETPVTITREQAKDMTSAARQIARSNGKRITMAMFFVEDL